MNNLIITFFQLAKNKVDSLCIGLENMSLPEVQNHPKTLQPISQTNQNGFKSTSWDLHHLSLGVTHASLQTEPQLNMDLIRKDRDDVTFIELTPKTAYFLGYSEVQSKAKEENCITFVELTAQTAFLLGRLECTLQMCYLESPSLYPWLYFIINHCEIS